MAALGSAFPAARPLRKSSSTPVASRRPSVGNDAPIGIENAPASLSRGSIRSIRSDGTSQASDYGVPRPAKLLSHSKLSVSSQVAGNAKDVTDAFHRRLSLSGTDAASFNALGEMNALHLQPSISENIPEDYAEKLEDTTIQTHERSIFITDDTLPRQPTHVWEKYNLYYHNKSAPATPSVFKGLDWVTLGVRNDQYTVSVSRDGRRLLVFDKNLQRELGVIYIRCLLPPQKMPVLFVVFLENRDNMLCGYGEDGCIRFWNLAKLELVQARKVMNPAADKIMSMCSDVANEYLWIGYDSGIIQQYQLNSLQKGKKLVMMDSWKCYSSISSLHFFHKGRNKYLSTAHHDGSSRLWTMAGTMIDEKLPDRGKGKAQAMSRSSTHSRIPLESSRPQSSQMSSRSTDSEAFASLPARSFPNRTGASRIRRCTAADDSDGESVAYSEADEQDVSAILDPHGMRKLSPSMSTLDVNRMGDFHKMKRVATTGAFGQYSRMNTTDQSMWASDDGSVIQANALASMLPPQPPQNGPPAMSAGSRPDENSHIPSPGESRASSANVMTQARPQSADVLMEVSHNDMEIDVPRNIKVNNLSKIVSMKAHRMDPKVEEPLNTRESFISHSFPDATQDSLLNSKPRHPQEFEEVRGFWAPTPPVDVYEVPDQSRMLYDLYGSFCDFKPTANFVLHTIRTNRKTKERQAMKIGLKKHHISSLLLFEPSSRGPQSVRFIKSMQLKKEIVMLPPNEPNNFSLKTPKPFKAIRRYGINVDSDSREAEADVDAGAGKDPQAEAIKRKLSKGQIENPQESPENSNDASVSLERSSELNDIDETRASSLDGAASVMSSPEIPAHIPIGRRMSAQAMMAVLEARRLFKKSLTRTNRRIRLMRNEMLSLVQPKRIDKHDKDIQVSRAERLEIRKIKEAFHKSVPDNKWTIHLRHHHRLVCDLIDTYWNRMTESIDLKRRQKSVFEKKCTGQLYCEFNEAIALSLGYDGTSAIASAEADWLSDSHGEGFVAYTTFFGSMLELCDIWCMSCAVVDFYKFLNCLFPLVEKELYKMNKMGTRVNYESRLKNLSYADNEEASSEAKTGEEAPSLQSVSAAAQKPKAEELAQMLSGYE